MNSFIHSSFIHILVHLFIYPVIHLFLSFFLLSKTGTVYVSLTLGHGGMYTTFVPFPECSARPNCPERSQIEAGHHRLYTAVCTVRGLGGIPRRIRTLCYRNKLLCTPRSWWAKRPGSRHRGPDRGESGHATRCSSGLSSPSGVLHRRNVREQ